MKSWKTSLVGILRMVFFFLCLALIYFKVITFTEFIGSLVVVGIFFSATSDLFSKDSDVTGGTRAQ